jgi:hypothetical protein
MSGRLPPVRSRALIACLLVCVAVVVGGCGTTTRTVRDTVSAQPIHTESIPTFTPTKAEAEAEATKRREEEEQKATERKEKAEEAKQAREEKAAEATQHAEEISKTPVPTPSQRYPEQVEHNILVACKAHEGTPAACQCELDRMEVAHSLEEVVAIEEGLRSNVPAPAWLQIETEECKKTYG